MDTKTQAILNEIARQRNDILNTLASLVGELAERDEKIAFLMKTVEELNAKLSPSPAIAANEVALEATQ